MVLVLEVAAYANPEDPNQTSLPIPPCPGSYWPETLPLHCFYLPRFLGVEKRCLLDEYHPRHEMMHGDWDAHCRNEMYGEHFPSEMRLHHDYLQDDFLKEGMRRSIHHVRFLWMRLHCGSFGECFRDNVGFGDRLAG